MHQSNYPMLWSTLVLFCSLPAASEPESVQVQPLSSVAIQNSTLDWKQANKKVAELGGWQFYASEAGGHQAMDHSGHHMPMDHSGHPKQDSDTVMDHSRHSVPVDHSKHHNHQQMDHSKHKGPQPAKQEDKHEHHH